MSSIDDDDAIYVDDLISSLRQCDYSVYIGNLFVGCVVYADDIVLLSVSCFGLQKLMDVCETYSGLWHIKFSPAKSQGVCFGSGNNQFCDYYLNGCAVAMVDKVKYLGVYFERKSGQCDISQAVIGFCSQFNNIMAIMGKNSNEITTLHLVKTYTACPTRL